MLLATGAILALITSSWSFFVYSNEFNIFDLFYFVITSGIALFITKRLDGALQRRRSQKDIIIKKIEEVDNEIKDLLPQFQYKDGRYVINNAILLSKIKNISRWAKRYEKSIEIYYNNLFKDKEFKKINTRMLVRQCTDLPNDETPNDDISCVDDFWYYSEAQFISISNEVEILRSNCYLDMILLNNYN